MFKYTKVTALREVVLWLITTLVLFPFWILIVTALGFFSTVCFYYYLAQPRKRPAEDFDEEGRP